MQSIKILKDTEIHHDSKLRLVSRRALLPTGEEQTQLVVDRGDSVAVIPTRVNEAGDVEVLVYERSQVSTDTPASTEIPADMMTPGEDDIHVDGRRALDTKVARGAQRTVVLTQDIQVAPAYSTQRLHVLVARDVYDAPDRRENPDAGGRWLTLQEALAEMDMGVIRDATTMLALLLLERKLRLGGELPEEKVTSVTVSRKKVLAAVSAIAPATHDELAAYDLFPAVLLARKLANSTAMLGLAVQHRELAAAGYLGENTDHRPWTDLDQDEQMEARRLAWELFVSAVVCQTLRPSGRGEE